jgi:O-antigen/teichoic acid export membrane protein
MSIFVIAVASVYRSHYALICGALLQRALMMVASHFFYRDIGVGFAWDREALRDQFRFARFVMPSSVLTIVLTQFDKVILLKLFNLSVLGIYGVANNMLGPINGVNLHNARVILYARCTQYFRTDRTTARSRYYLENRRLMDLGVVLAAGLAGSAPAIVAILYDPRYSMVGEVLTILSLGAIVNAIQNSSENLLVAQGQTHIVLVSNVIRLFTVIPSTLLGYHYFGFYGFLWFGLIGALPLLIYLFLQQYRRDLLSIREELRRFALGLLVFGVAFAASKVVLLIIPLGWLHLGIKGH